MPAKALNEAVEKADAAKDEPDADETSELSPTSTMISRYGTDMDAAMDVDTTVSKPRADRKRITKRKVKKSKIVFKKARDKSSQRPKGKVSK